MSTVLKKAVKKQVADATDFQRRQRENIAVDVFITHMRPAFQTQNNILEFKKRIWDSHPQPILHTDEYTREYFRL